MSTLRDAWDEFADVFESDPGRVDAPLLLGMGRACEACGWNREAAAWFREALRLSPDDPAAREGLERAESIPRG